MPLQNRVTPFGAIVAPAGPGTMLGNRGVVHDERGSIVRPWQTRRWICCVLEFKGRHRQVMEPKRWTHLFFLDEATAFAAGHRPCAECRRADYVRFRQTWESLYGPVSRVEEIDNVLHEARLERKQKRIYRAQSAALPNGTFFASEGDAWMVWGSQAFRWSDRGYIASRERPDEEVDVLTPRPFVELFAGGYEPAIHPSLISDGARPARNNSTILRIAGAE